MLARFSLYGFLKNQRYFEPFLYLVFLEYGLSFLQIGLLVGFREICVSVFEVPSGVLADTLGRRKLMIGSFLAYIAGFTVLAISAAMPALYLAMLLLAWGDASRSGTHKALIFEWLRHEGRQAEKVKVYGYTRSWSKLGSALSVVLAAIFVCLADSYNHIFWYSIPPYVLGIVNFLAYPKYLDGTAEGKARQSLIAHFRVAISTCWQRVPLRKLCLESMSFEGSYKAMKDYLQPLLAATALTALSAAQLSDTQRTAIAVGVVYMLLHLLSSWASRRAHRVNAWRGGEEPAARFIWWASVGIFAVLAAACWWQLHALIIAVFVALAMLQNIWRPVLMARFDAHTDSANSATILSVESQCKSTGAFLLAPLFGYCVDQQGFWTLGAVAGTLALATVMSIHPKTPAS
ncbi:MAG: MFS family permease [Rhodothermales bacterium]|jgi:MFS family permease